MPGQGPQPLGAGGIPWVWSRPRERAPVPSGALCRSKETSQRPHTRPSPGLQGTWGASGRHSVVPRPAAPGSLLETGWGPATRVLTGPAAGLMVREV